MAIKVTILGANSAIPTASRFPSAQIIECNSSIYLMDCGEGTQIQLRKNKIKIQRIKAIFISHMHGDHYFGLAGLLNTMHLLGRNKPLLVYGPPELKQIIELQIDIAETKFNYKWEFRAVDSYNPSVVYEDTQLSVKTITLYHRIPCAGFIFRENDRKRKVKKELAEMHKVPLVFYPNLKMGEDFVNSEGDIIPNSLLTENPLKAVSYAYCSDTKFDERVAEAIKNVTAVYHEATFTSEMQERAQQTYHSTAKEAATIALLANAKLLIIGHYSARYFHFNDHEMEARAVFENTELAIEGRSFIIE